MNLLFIDKLDNLLTSNHSTKVQVDSRVGKILN